MTLDPMLISASAVGEFVAIIFMVRAKVWRILPVFGAYVVWALLSDLIWLLLQSSIISKPFSSSTSNWIFLAETVIDSILQFTVLVELTWSVLRPVRASLPRGTQFILALLIAFAGLLIWPLVIHTVPPLRLKQDLLIFHVQETFAILRICCFLVMAGFSQLLSIGWKDRELQVATGLGFYSIVSLLVMLLHAHQGAGNDAYHRLDEAVSVSYLGTLTYWVFSFVTKEQERKEFSPQMQNLLLQLGGGARTGRIALIDLPSERPRKKD
jgi:hypothetical protein